MAYTVLGAGGFVGSNLVRHLREMGQPVYVPARDEIPANDLGHIIYCIGLTSDFRIRPFDTVEAHVEVLRRVLQETTFESLTYLSSTRIYEHAPRDVVAVEEDLVLVDPKDQFSLFGLSKLLGESLCLSMPNPNVRAVRLSNVYGMDDTSNNFLTSVLAEGLSTGKVVLRTALDAAKDYIAISDVVEALRLIPLRASSRLLNLASGVNVSNQEIVSLLETHVGCQVDVRPSDKTNIFPILSIEKLRNEIGIVPLSLEQTFPDLVAGMREVLVKAYRGGDDIR